MKNTNVISGDDVNLTLMIRNKKENGDVYLKRGSVISVESVALAKIVSSDATIIEFRHMGLKKYLKFKRDKIQDIEVYTYTQSSAYPSEYFAIRIKGKRNLDFTDKSEMKIKIWDASDMATPICEESLDIYYHDGMAISEFKADAPIVKKGTNVRIQYQVDIDAEDYELFLSENGKILYNHDELPRYTSDQDGVGVIEIDMGMKPSSLYQYSLHLKQGEKIITKSDSIQYAELSEIHTRSTPRNFQVINFCLSQDGVYLFALMRFKDELRLYATTHLDGNSWTQIVIDNLKEIFPFIDSPMVHLVSVNEQSSDSLGRILFIGGSAIALDNAQRKVASCVASIPLKLNSESANSVDIIRQESWVARWGHTCIVYPSKSSAHTIWMLGGANKKGQPLNEIWSSTDGKTWRQESNPSQINRVMSAATVVNHDDGRSEMWYGGGAAGFGKESMKDILRFRDGKWEVLADTKLDNNIKSFGMSYGGKDDASHTGVYILGVSSKGAVVKNINEVNAAGKNKLVTKMNANTPKVNISAFNQGRVVSAYFKGCWYFMKVEDYGSTGTLYSDLYFRIPIIQEKIL